MQIIKDYIWNGCERLTCGEFTLVRQPYHSDIRWLQAKDLFYAKHDPKYVRLDLGVNKGDDEK